jgi:hypothetical protein
VFARVEGWLRSSDRWRRVIALSAHVRRLCAPKKPESHRSELVDNRWIDRSRYEGKLVLAAVTSPEELAATLRSLNAIANRSDTLALELLVVADDTKAVSGLLEHAKEWLRRVRSTPPAVTARR